jgi:hypothetical protein
LWRPYALTPALGFSIPESTGKLVSVQSEQMWGEILGIKDTLLPFMTILRAGTDPRALERFQFLPSKTTVF